MELYISIRPQPCFVCSSFPIASITEPMHVTRLALKGSLKYFAHVRTWGHRWIPRLSPPRALIGRQAAYSPGLTAAPVLHSPTIKPLNQSKSAISNHNELLSYELFLSLLVLSCFLVVVLCTDILSVDSFLSREHRRKNLDCPTRQIWHRSLLVIQALFLLLFLFSLSLSLSLSVFNILSTFFQHKFVWVNSIHYLKQFCQSTALWSYG